MKKMYAVVLSVMMMFASSLQAQTVKPNFNSIKVSSINVSDVQVYVGQEEKTVFKGMIQLVKFKDQVNKVNYIDQASKGLNLKGNLNDGTLILNTESRESVVPQEAQANLIQIQSTVRAALEKYNATSEFDINYVNIPFLMTLDINELNLFYTQDNQVVISKELDKNNDIIIDAEGVDNELNKFFFNTDDDSVIQFYYIPFELVNYK